MSKACKLGRNKTRRKAPVAEVPREPEEEEALPRELECFVVLESETDKTDAGNDMVLGFNDPEPQRFPARLTITVDEVRPLNLFRQGGQWCMAFNFMGNNGPSPVLAVKCGVGGAPSMEEAASLFYGGVPEWARTSDKTGTLGVEVRK